MKFGIRHTCGHVADHQLTGPGRQRQQRADWLATLPCPDCAADERANERAAANAVAAEHAAVADWPTLTGSDRQVAWATTLRHQMLVSLAADLPGPLTDDGRERIAALITRAAMRQTTAAWWIDHRTDLHKALGATLTPAEHREFTTIAQEART